MYSDHDDSDKPTIIQSDSKIDLDELDGKPDSAPASDNETLWQKILKTNLLYLLFFVVVVNLFTGFIASVCVPQLLMDSIKASHPNDSKDEVSNIAASISGWMGIGGGIAGAISLNVWANAVKKMQHVHAIAYIWVINAGLMLIIAYYPTEYYIVIRTILTALIDGSAFLMSAWISEAASHHDFAILSSVMGLIVAAITCVTPYMYNVFSVSLNNKQILLLGAFVYAVSGILVYFMKQGEYYIHHREILYGSGAGSMKEPLLNENNSTTINKEPETQHQGLCSKVSDAILHQYHVVRQDFGISLLCIYTAIVSLSQGCIAASAYFFFDKLNFPVSSFTVILSLLSAGVILVQFTYVKLSKIIGVSRFMFICTVANCAACVGFLFMRSHTTVTFLFAAVVCFVFSYTNATPVNILMFIITQFYSQEHLKEQRTHAIAAFSVVASLSASIGVILSSQLFRVYMYLPYWLGSCFVGIAIFVIFYYHTSIYERYHKPLIHI